MYAEHKQHHVLHWAQIRNFPHEHHLAEKFNHLIHDERFWVLFAAGAFFLLLIALSIWLLVTQEGATATRFTWPGTPMPYVP